MIVPGPQPDVEQGLTGPQVGQQVGGGVLGRAPGVAAQDGFVVPVRVGHAYIVTCPNCPRCRPWPSASTPLLAGLTLRRADLLGFSSLKTYDPSPESLKGHGAALGRAAGPSTWCGTSTTGTAWCCTSPRPAGSIWRSRRRRRSPGARWPASSSGRGTAGSTAAGVGILVREYGTQRKASWWVLAPGDEGPLADLGPEPGSDEFAEFIRTSDSKRHLTTDLRDQHVVSGIGRGWGDDILQRAKLSPFASLRSLTPDQREALLAAATDVLGRGARARARRARAGSRSRAWAAASRCTAASASPARPAATTLAACLVRVLRNGLLPDLPDGRQGAGRPPALAACSSRGQHDRRTERRPARLRRL